MNLAEIEGKPFTLWLTDEAEESVVLPGVAHWDGSALTLKRGQQPPFEIRSEWYERIQAVTNEEVRKILQGADYFLHLFVGNIPQDDTGELEQTGLKWPE